MKNFIAQHHMMARLSAGLRSALAALPLLVSAGCGVDSTEPGDDNIASESSAILSGCHILLPLVWEKNGFRCSSVAGSIDLVPGQLVQINDARMHGSVKIRCHSNGDGGWDEFAKACTNQIIVPGLDEP